MVSHWLILFPLLIWAFSESTAKPTQVLYMSEDGDYNLPGFYIKTVRDFEVQNFSICTWLHLTHIRQTNSPIIGFSDEIIEYLTYRNLGKDYLKKLRCFFIKYFLQHSTDWNMTQLLNMLHST